jgi:hypothetical protein
MDAQRMVIAETCLNAAYEKSMAFRGRRGKSGQMGTGEPAGLFVRGLLQECESLRMRGLLRLLLGTPRSVLRSDGRDARRALFPIAR